MSGTVLGGPEGCHLLLWTANVAAVTTHVGSERGNTQVAPQLTPGWNQAENPQQQQGQRTERRGSEVWAGMWQLASGQIFCDESHWSRADTVPCGHRSPLHTV